MPRTEFARAFAGLREPLLVVVAGSNGAGKTTFYERFLAHLPLRFVNADRVAAALSPADPAAATATATRLADAMRRDLMARRQSFIMETVFSDPVGDKLAFLQDSQQQGYAIVLLFVGLESAELSAARVAERVALGGHDVPDERIVARFPRTLRNLQGALRFVDAAVLLDNSSSQQPYRWVATWRGGRLESQVPDPPAWCP